MEPSSRPGLIYLPGLDGTGRLLHRQPRLWQDYQVRCVAYPQDRPHTYDEAADLAIRQLEEVGPGVILAESFGGAVALMATLRRPDLVTRLVLVNTFARFPRRFIIGLASRLGGWLPNKPSHPSTRRVRGWFFFGGDIPQSERDQWWERTGDVPMRAFGHRFRLIAGLDLRPRLGEVKTPALVLAAPNDRVVPPSAGRELARLLPQARLIEPLAGHAALIHPGVDVAALLAESSLWPAVEAVAAR